MPIIMHAEEIETRDSCHEDVPILVKAEEVVTGSRLWSLSFAKRIMDFIVSLVALVAALVPGIIIYVLVRVTSQGPGFFRQKRVGYRGRLFALYKFRTMEVAQEGSGPCLTRDADPRITTIGKILRKLKLDELPQFYNVLRGEMSLVGPRPKLPVYAAATDAFYRPGLTGFATLLFRREEQLLKHVAPGDLDSFYERRIKPLKARADFQYMKRASFVSDARILFRTVFASLIPSVGVGLVRKRQPKRRFVFGQRARRSPSLRTEFE